MKKFCILLAFILLLVLTACKEEKDLYLPEAQNDEIFTLLGNA